MSSLPPGHQPGLETRLLRAWPWGLLGGTLLPLLIAGLIGALFPDPPSAAEHKQQLLAWFTLIGAVACYWSLMLTVAAGCWVVRVMKGPVRELDPYPLPERNRLRA
jgi:hypothetical protein